MEERLAHALLTNMTLKYVAGMGPCHASSLISTSPTWVNIALAKDKYS